MLIICLNNSGCNSLLNPILAYNNNKLSRSSFEAREFYSSALEGINSQTRTVYPFAQTFFPMSTTREAPEFV